MRKPSASTWPSVNAAPGGDPSGSCVTAILPSRSTIPLPSLGRHLYICHIRNYPYGIFDVNGTRSIAAPNFRCRPLFSPDAVLEFRCRARPANRIQVTDLHALVEAKGTLF